MIIYLNVSYKEKDEAKKMGARWCRIKKQWFIENLPDITGFLKWMPEHLTKPHVPHKSAK